MPWQIWNEIQWYGKAKSPQDSITAHVLQKERQNTVCFVSDEGYAGARHGDYTRTWPLPPSLTFREGQVWEGRSREGNRLIKQYQTPQEWDRISPNPTKPKHAMQQVRETIKRSYFKSIPLKGKYNVSVPLLENITFSTTRNFGNISYQQFAQQ